MKRKERKYLSEQYLDKKFFVEYLPTKIYDSLTDEEKVNYREYRRYSFFISRSKKKIEDLESQIKKLELKIQNELEKHKDVVDVYYTEDLKRNRDTIEYGWNSKMKNHYQKLSHVHQKFDFNIWWEKRPISNKTLDLRSGKKIIHETEFQRDVKKYGGRELKVRYRWYFKIKGVGSKPSKNIYLGDEKSIRIVLGEVYQNDFSKDNWDDVKTELKRLIESYVVYHLMNKGWDTFMIPEKYGGDTHSLRTIKDWVISTGDDWYNFIYEKKDFSNEVNK